MEAQTLVGQEILFTLLIHTGPGAHLASPTVSTEDKLAVCGVTTTPLLAKVKI
jgi:hypothetical protein